MSSIIYPGLAHVELGLASALYKDQPWETVRENAWLRYRQITHGIGDKQEFLKWADQQRRESEDAGS